MLSPELMLRASGINFMSRANQIQLEETKLERAFLWGFESDAIWYQNM